MWHDMVEHLADFSSAVLTGVDTAGYPFSIRCEPEIDASRKELRVQVPEYADIQPGPTGLLCHKHDEELWNLKSFIVRGKLERNPEGWRFHPQRFTPGAGIGGLMGMVKFLRSGRRTAKKYLDKRGLARPSIPWDKIQALWEEIKETRERANEGDGL
jgi:hypothetical protein